MTEFGSVLASKGKLEDATAHSVSSSDLPYPASTFLGSSQHVRGERAKALGWEPRPVVLQDWAEEGISASLGKL